MQPEVQGSVCSGSNGTACNPVRCHPVLLQQAVLSAVRVVFLSEGSQSFREYSGSCPAHPVEREEEGEEEGGRPGWEGGGGGEDKYTVSEDGWRVQRNQKWVRQVTQHGAAEINNAYYYVKCEILIRLSVSILRGHKKSIFLFLRIHC